MTGILDFAKSLNGKRAPVFIAIVVAVQTAVQISAVWFGQTAAVKELNRGQNGIVEEQRRTREAVNAVATYVKEGTLTKAEAGYLWRKREREEIAPMYRRIGHLERKAGIVPEDYKENIIDLPDWNETAKPPVLWLDDKAAGN